MALSRPDWAAAAAPALTGLGLGLLALGPGLGRGYLLSYDMVFVPTEPLSAATAGFSVVPPRAVPSDLVVAIASRLLPSDLVQKMLLLAIFVLACSGAAALLSGEHVAARLTAGIFYAWNPYVGERLILGQWALLLGYAGLPWVLVALTRPAASWRRRTGRLAAALVPAAVGGFAAMCVSALLVVSAALAAPAAKMRERMSRTATAFTVLGVLSLPWLIPALLRPVFTSPAGVAAFAARADTHFGSVGSLLMLGGTWNSQTVPAGYGGPVSALWLAVVVLAIAGFCLLGRSRWPGLGPAAVIGLAIACLGAFAGGQSLLRNMIAGWPGFAILRDGQQFVAPLALAEAAGAGLAIAWLLGARKPAALREIGWLATAFALVAPVLLLPGLAWGAAGRLNPVQYPRDWMAARAALDRQAVDGKVLLLPWAAYRRFGWNHGEAMLDPWPRLLKQQVVWNDAVRVGNMTIPAENPLAARLSRIIESPGPLTRSLAADGIRYVIVDAGPGPQGGDHAGAAGFPYRSRLPGCTILVSGPGIVVYKVLPRAA